MAISLANNSPTRLGLPPDEKGQKLSMWHRLGLRRWLGRDDRDGQDFPHRPSSPRKQDNLTRRLSRRVGVGLPRSTTFKRQISERRDHLAPLEPEHRRAHSADRRTLSARRTRSPPPVDPRLSLPEVQWLGPPATTVDEPETSLNYDLETDSLDWTPDVTTAPEAPTQDTLEMELERRWILNLSMHFRDRSEREKFFVTYAETPTKWRRVTISCDYRAAPPDSLEQDLKELRYQRDKCARIYESIRESLLEIQFYDTVTNLKVETRDGRLHVHVTEDVNETIPYPPISSIGHLPGAREAGRSRDIKKEIPGPDTVDEFLYEINALHALSGAPNVIQVEGIVVDERQEVVKGLLINYAEQGALVDILYEQRGRIAFGRRERWAKQIVQGLCEIHESGYVQGDFTLSNIVVDGDDNAHIIDINRRGCPVGWEPPEIAAKIESNQRISMYIGVKTDLYQLGMTLWALIMEEDEPERQPRPLMFDIDSDVPDYYRRLVEICLSPTPRHRLAAKDLLRLFPPDLLSRPFPPQDADIGSPLTRLPNRIPSKTSFDRNSLKSHPSQPIFSENHDQGKGSTPTLTGSNRGACFPSRHSSASTLNHHEHNEVHGEINKGWANYHQLNCNAGELAREVSSEIQTKNAKPLTPANDCGVDPVEQQQAPHLEESTIPSCRYTKEPVHPADQIEPSPMQPLHIPAVPPPVTNDGYEDAAASAGEEECQSRHDAPDTESRPVEGLESPSLLHSVLPINPAHTLSRRRTFPAVSQDVKMSPSPERFEFDSPPLVQLSESLLPINPAFGAPVSKSPPLAFRVQTSYQSRP
ncbi:hypothetical protein N7470_001155 [Penicillium chermesinum]|nr:hypothetical protein N7470_001155 [Penicillium chermesinum]